MLLATRVGMPVSTTPSALAVMTAALLAWKKRLAGFSLGLTDAELQSAILLAILAFVIYPALPEASIDPWQLVRPRAAWVTVLLIAAIGFANYVLLKLFGTRAVELTGFLGGLVNSTVTVTSLAERVHEEPALVESAYHGIMLATVAMLVRNAAILVILAPRALVSAIPALLLMLMAGVALSGLLNRRRRVESAAVLEINLRSPFSLASALKFGLLFLALEIAGTLAQGFLGRAGFYAVSLVGGMISSASAVASAGSLATHGTIPFEPAGVGAVLASLTSALVNLPLVARIGRERPLTRRIAWSLGLIVLLGVVGAVAATLLPESWLEQLRHFQPPRRPEPGASPGEETASSASFLGRLLQGLEDDLTVR